MNKTIDKTSAVLSVALVLGFAVSALLPGKIGIFSRFVWHYLLFTHDGAIITLVCMAIALIVGGAMTYMIKFLEKENGR